MSKKKSNSSDRKSGTAKAGKRHGTIKPPTNRDKVRVTNRNWHEWVEKRGGWDMLSDDEKRHAIFSGKAEVLIKHDKPCVLHLSK